MKKTASERTLPMFHCDDFDDEPTIPSMRTPVIVSVREATREILTPMRLMSLTGILAACFVSAGAFWHDLNAIGIGGLVLIFGNLQGLVRR